MRRFPFSALLLLLSLAPLQAAVKGVVLSPAGLPLRATVTVHPLESSSDVDARVRDGKARPELARASADERGSFSVEAKSAVIVSIVAPGYAPQSDLAASDDDLGVVVLRPAAARSGKVTGGGKPLANAVIRVTAGDSELLVKSDEAGKFTVPDPNVWGSSITVAHPDFAPLRVATLSPERKFDLDLRLESGVSLKGKVLAADGTAAEGARILVDGVELAKSGADGTFDIAHAPKNWRDVVAQKNDLVAGATRSKSDPVLKLRKGGTVTGAVVDGRTKKPLVGALVRLGATDRFRNDGPSVLTDAKGNFNFTAVSPSTLALVARYPGYQLNQVDVTVRERGTETRTISGAALARVQGVVVDEAKSGVALARVSSRSASLDPFSRGPMSMNSAAWSAPDGSFVLRNVAPNTEWTFSAEKKGLPAATTAPMKLANGEVRRDLRLVLPRGVHVSGVVVDADDRPVANVEVRSSESENAGGGMRIIMRGGPSRDDDPLKTTAEGKFDLQLKPGTYDLTFSANGYATKRQRGLKVADAVEPLRIRLERGMTISGRVVRDSGEGVADVIVGSFSESGSSTSTTAADGSFVLENLAAGPQMVNFAKIDESLREMRTIEAPNSNYILRLPKTTRIEGRVIDKATGAPITAFRVGLSGDRSTGMMVMRAPTVMRDVYSEGGEFVIENVPVGSTAVVAEAAGYVRRTVSGVDVTGEKPVTGLEIALDAGVRVTGRVTDAEGNPLEGVAVAIDADESRAMPFGPNGAPNLTDAAGQYTIESQPAGERIVSFRKNGYAPERKDVKLAGGEVRVDARLGSGITVNGVVVTEGGAPVSEAYVRLGNVGMGERPTMARTDANGAFRMEGLTAGTYTFTASKEGLVTGNARGVDIASTPSVRIVMGSGGVVSGHVSGLSGEELASTVVEVHGGSFGTRGNVDANGNFRIEGVQAGTMIVSARVESMRGMERSSESKSIEVSAGQEASVDLRFSDDVIVRGRVTRNGQPVEGARVIFEPRGSGLPHVESQTKSGGAYDAVGLQSGKYEVIVFDFGRFGAYHTEYQVSGSGTFDIDMKGFELRGRVIDSSTGEAISDARVRVRSATDDRSFFGPEMLSSSTGGFSTEGLEEGRYIVTAIKDGYGQATYEADVREGTPLIELKMQASDAAVVRIVDARDGRALTAFVSATDASNRDVYSSLVRPRPDGTARLPLAPGTYRLRVGSQGYAATSVTLTSPTSAAITIALSTGGVLVVQSDAQYTGRLLDANGRLEREFGVVPGSNRYELLSGGVYNLQLLDRDGAVVKTVTVTVNEGQTTNTRV